MEANMAEEIDLDSFEKSLKARLKEGRQAFKGKYKRQLDELAGLSREEIDEITPDIEDLHKYDELITVVKEASRANLAQAELKHQIEKLGAVAVQIAQKVPSLAKLFV
jgi:hypothetical protein